MNLEERRLQAERMIIQADHRKNLPRPERVTYTQTPVGPRRPASAYPKKYRECLEYNQKIKICCRHMENITGQMYKTNPDLPAADLLILTCNVCKCNHYRVAVGEQGKISL